MKNFVKSRQLYFLLTIAAVLGTVGLAISHTEAESNGVGLYVESAVYAEGAILTGDKFSGLGIVPISSVTAYMSATAPPDGWLECDGRALSSSEYPDLYSVIEQMYGDGSSDDDFSTDFNLPDLRGYFLRGWDHNLVGEDERQAVDPDRINAESGIGTKQEDTFQEHQHKYVDKYQKDYTFKRGIYSNAEVAHRHEKSDTKYTSGFSGGSRTSSETRPKNISVMYIIRVK